MSRRRIQELGETHLLTELRKPFNGQELYQLALTLTGAERA
jgi:hypothetical protein